MRVFAFPPRLPRRSLRACAAGLLLLALTACSQGGGSKGPAHPALLASDANRDRLRAEILVPNLQRTLASADTLKADGNLPFGGSDLRQMMAARAGLSTELLDLVDAAQPIALAVVDRPASADPNAPAETREPLIAMAITLRPLAAAAGATNLLAAIGTPAETRKEAQRFARADGSSLWVARMGNGLQGRVVLAESFDGLSEAGAHAIAASDRRDADNDDLVATVFPQAQVRRDGGQIRQRAMRTYESELRDPGQPAVAAERAALEAALDFVLAPFTETDRVRLGAWLSSERGFGFGLRATPRPGTPFVRRLGNRARFSVPAAAVTGSPALLLATGALPSWPVLAQNILDGQAKAGVPGAGPIATRLRALLPLLTGAVVESTRAEGDLITLDWSLELVPGARPLAATDALAALVADPALSQLLMQVFGRHTPRIEPARTGNRLEVTFAFPDPDRLPPLARVLAGGPRVTFVVEEVGNRLLFGSGPGAVGRLQELAAARAGGRGSGALATALSDNEGKEALIYVEAAGLARPVLRASLSGSQRRFFDMVLGFPGLSGLSLPIWLSLDGGEIFSADLRVPLVALKNASMLMSLLGGTGAEAPPP